MSCTSNESLNIPLILKLQKVLNGSKKIKSNLLSFENDMHFISTGKIPLKLLSAHHWTPEPLSQRKKQLCQDFQCLCVERQQASIWLIVLSCASFHGVFQHFSASMNESFSKETILAALAPVSGDSLQGCYQTICNWWLHVCLEGGCRWNMPCCKNFKSPPPLSIGTLRDTWPKAATKVMYHCERHGPFGEVRMQSRWDPSRAVRVGVGVY